MEDNTFTFQNELTDNSDLKNELLKVKKTNKVLKVIVTFFATIFITLIIIFAIAFMNLNKGLSRFIGRKIDLASISQMTSSNNIDLKKFATKLAFVDDVINLMYYYDKDNEKVIDSMFKGYMSALGDKYADYYPRDDFKDFTEKTTEGVYYGIGCIVNQDKDTKDCIVNTVYENSPADRGGIISGDIFVSVNGEYVRGIDLQDLIQKIRGEEGAKRIIELYRPSLNKNISATVYCGKVDIKLVDSKVYEGNIGYLDIDEFTGKAAVQFKQEIDKLLRQKVKGIIIDLRDNPGGELMTVCEMMDYLMRDNDGTYTLNQEESVFEDGKTLLVYIKEKEDIVDAAYASDKHAVEVPFVILTNLNTASAAELFTECLRDYKKATVVGIKTYGKGVVQNVIPYEDGSAIKFTVSEYFPPSGYSIDKKGIIPDYSLDYNGNEVEYDEDSNILLNDNGNIITVSNDGQMISERIASIATLSEIKSLNVNLSSDNRLKIYDSENDFLNEDWYLKLDEKYDDKQLLQAIVLMK